jgi:hypothetical protein
MKPMCLVHSSINDNVPEGSYHSDDVLHLQLLQSIAESPEIGEVFKIDRNMAFTETGIYGVYFAEDLELV